MQSRIENILKAMIDNKPYSSKPLSRVEAILLAIKNNVPYHKLPKSRIEDMLLAIKNGSSYDSKPQGRIEEILFAKIHGLEYIKKPQSRIEELLIEWISYGTDIDIEGIPPIAFTSKGKALKNYRIYGQTVDGESVGDLVNEGEHAGEYRVPVTVEGKNLWDEIYTDIVVNTVKYRSIAVHNGMYTLSSNIDLGGSASLFLLIGKVTSGANANSNGVWDGNSKIINVLDGYLTIGYRIYGNKNPEDCEVQLEKGSVATDYEPYHEPITTNIYLSQPIRKVGNDTDYLDYVEQKLVKVRKNLLDNVATSQTIHGVTITINADKTITCNGTATERIGLRINATMLQSGDYICSNNIQGSSTSYYVDWTIRAASSITLKEYRQAIKITTDEPVNVTAWINIVSGYNCNNITFSPMIRKADIEDDTYEPYISDTELDVELPELPTIAGTNILFVDTQVQPSKVYVEGEIKEDMANG